MRISVVIPAFNAEEFLEECLESVASQSFREFEAIVIDDGSSDSTPEIAAWFAKRDSRFKVITTRNGGLSKARNVGIEFSKGELLTFLDADDCLLPDFLETLYSSHLSEKADIVRAAFIRGERFTFPEVKETKIKVLDFHDAIKTTLYQKIKLNPAWAMLIRRDILEQVGGFREGILYEDLDAFYKFFERANKIVYIPQPLYFYRKNQKGLTGHWSGARLDVLDVTDRIVEYMRDRYPELLPAAEDRRFSAHFNMLLLMRRYNVENPEAMERCKKVIRAGRRRALSDPKVRFKNKLGAILSYLIL